MTPGHLLEAEGRAYKHGYRRATGKAHCSCGASSVTLPSDSSRKRWHEDHLTAIAVGAAHD